jgi:hypothetical protein
MNKKKKIGEAKMKSVRSSNLSRISEPESKVLSTKELEP